MATHDPDPEASPPSGPPLMALLEEAFRLLHDRFSDVMAAGGHPQTLAESKVMGVLTTDGLRLSELADRLGITKQSVAQVVDGLEADGYVRRRPDPEDGRAKRIVFGPRGDEALPVAWEALRASDEVAEDALGEDGAAQLRGALETLIDTAAPQSAGPDEGG